MTDLFHKLFLKSNSLFWYYIIQVMNVYECNGKNIFMRRKMQCSIFNEAIAELNRTFQLSPNKNILTIARIKTFIICFI